MSEDKRGPGQPTKYKPEFCELVIDHLRKGGSIESFGAVAQCGKQTIYNWKEAHPEFLDAITKGEALRVQYYEGMARMIATGQLRRVKSERPKIIKDKDGNEMVAVDPSTGEVVYEREYEPAQGSAAVFIFMAKNMIHWRDRRDLELTGKDGEALFAGMSAEALKKELAELNEQAKIYLLPPPKEAKKAK